MAVNMGQFPFGHADVVDHVGRTRDERTVEASGLTPVGRSGRKGIQSSECSWLRLVTSVQRLSTRTVILQMVGPHLPQRWCDLHHRHVTRHQAVASSVAKPTDQPHEQDGDREKAGEGESTSTQKTEFPPTIDKSISQRLRQATYGWFWFYQHRELGSHNTF